MRNEIQSLVEELNNMYYGNKGQVSFPVDVVEEKNCYKVYAEIPGVDKKNISITFENGRLAITATKDKDEKKYVLRERSAKKFAREIYFGDIEEESMSASYVDGVLEIVINLKAPEVKEKKVIEIQ